MSNMAKHTSAPASHWFVKIGAACVPIAGGSQDLARRTNRPRCRHCNPAQRRPEQPPRQVALRQQQPVIPRVLD